MIPFAVIHERDPQQPARPVVWSSRINPNVKGPEIIQPKTKIIREGEPPRQTERDIRGSYGSIRESNGQTTDNVSGHHVIGSKYGKAFRLSDDKDGDRYKTDSRMLEDKELIQRPT
jgi:hypothetical protein